MASTGSNFKTSTSESGLFELLLIILFPLTDKLNFGTFASILIFSFNLGESRIRIGTSELGFLVK